MANGRSETFDLQDTDFDINNDMAGQEFLESLEPRKCYVASWKPTRENIDTLFREVDDMLELLGREPRRRSGGGLGSLAAPGEGQDDLNDFWAQIDSVDQMIGIGRQQPRTRAVAPRYHTAPRDFRVGGMNMRDILGSFDSEEEEAEAVAPMPRPHWRTRPQARARGLDIFLERLSGNSSERGFSQETIRAGGSDLSEAPPLDENLFDLEFSAWYRDQAGAGDEHAGRDSLEVW